MQESQVRSLRWEDALAEEEQPTSVFLLWKFHGERNLAGYSSWCRKRVRHELGTKEQVSDLL